MMRLTRLEESHLELALERREGMAPSPALRRSVRERLGALGRIVVELRCPGTGLAHFVVTPTDLGAGGMSFLHGKFVYPGTVCIAKLRALDGRTTAVSGRVLKCGLLAGRIHEAAVRFEHPINLSFFLAPLSDEASGANVVNMCEVWERVEALSEKIRHAVMMRDGVAAANLARQVEQMCAEASAAGA